MVEICRRFAVDSEQVGGGSSRDAGHEEFSQAILVFFRYTTTL
jgi:hypothetical protein